MGCGGSKVVTSQSQEKKDQHASTTRSVAPTVSGEANDAAIASFMRSKRAAKRDNIFAESVGMDDGKGYEKKIFSKSEEERNLLRDALGKNFLFQGMTESEMREIIDAMEDKSYEEGQTIIKQGDTGDFFYVVDCGEFDVFVNQKKVHKYTSGGSFGELALLYNCPRAATVRATKPAKLWLLDRQIFRFLVTSKHQQNQSTIKTILRRAPLLQSLTEEQISKTADAVHTVSFEEGKTIIRKGDEGNVVFFIKEGTVDCTEIGSGNKEVVTLSEGDYFGERALIKNEPRAANVTARTNVTLYVLDREAFQEILGPLRDLLDFNLSIRCEYALSAGIRCLSTLNDDARTLKSVSLLKQLEESERVRLVSQFTVESYKKGDFVIKDGEEGNKFYIIREGNVSVEKNKDGEVTKIVDLGSGDYFGEMAILKAEPRKADVVVTSEVGEFLVLERSKFTDVLGPLQNILNRESKKRENELSTKLKKDITLQELEILSILGTGTFGRVKLTRNKKNGEVYALKVMHKQQIVDYKQTKNVITEKKVMMLSDHPFILKLIATFKDSDRLYMLLEFVQGGELFTYLHCSSRSTEYIPNDHARFYAGQVLDAMHYLHQRKIVYRDLKPENLMIDHRGYIKVVDFGFARIVEDRTYTLCGTPEYLAPEIVLGRGHNKAVDYWAIGILIYEMTVGYSPFAGPDGCDQVTICRNIVNGKIEFPPDISVTEPCKDIIRRLLTKDPTKRVGSLKNGADDIKNHSWFSGYDFEKLRRREYKAPWIPKVRSAIDTSHFEVNDEEPDMAPYVPDGSNWDSDF